MPADELNSNHSHNDYSCGCSAGWSGRAIRSCECPYRNKFRNLTGPRRSFVNHDMAARINCTQYFPPVQWGCSSAGRAPRSQRGGHRFDPGQLHHFQSFAGSQNPTLSQCCHISLGSQSVFASKTQPTPTSSHEEILKRPSMAISVGDAMLVFDGDASQVDERNVDVSPIDEARV